MTLRYWKDLTNEEQRRAIRAYIAHEGRARIASRYQIAPTTGDVLSQAARRLVLRGLDGRR